MPRGSCWLDGAAKGEPPAGGTKVGVAKGICVVCWPGCCIKGATPAMGEVPITGIDPIMFYAACGAAVLLLIALIAVIVKHSNEEKQRRERLARRRAQREKERSEAKASVEE